MTFFYTYYIILAKKGSIFTFGNYEQNKGKAEPIEWIVLDKKDSELFLISKKVLYYKNYSDNNSKNIAWENSSIRKWLNNEFYNKAFSNEEKTIIATTAVAADPDPPRF